MFLFDQKRELEAIIGYTDSIDVAVLCKDFATRDLMEQILIASRDHCRQSREILKILQIWGSRTTSPFRSEVKMEHEFTIERRTHTVEMRVDAPNIGKTTST